MHEIALLGGAVVAVALGVHYAHVIAPRALFIAKHVGICLACILLILAAVGAEFAVATALNNNADLLNVSLMLTALALAYGAFWWIWLDKGMSRFKIRTWARAVYVACAVTAFAFSAPMVLNLVAKQAEWAAVYTPPSPGRTLLGGGWRSAPLIEPVLTPVEYDPFAERPRNIMERLRAGSHYVATHPLGTLRAIWEALTWGEVAGIVIYLLGMRVFAELNLEYRAQMGKLPRYMVRMISDDWPSLIIWPFLAVVLTACDVIGYKENKANVQRFVDEQLKRERGDRHPWFQ